MVTLTGPAEAPFALPCPDNWERVGEHDMEREDDQPPAVVLRRSDGRGIVTLTIKGPLRMSLGDLREGFHAQMSERFPDFELLSTQTVDVAAGESLYSCFALNEQRQVRLHLVVPGGEHTYLLEGVMPSGAEDVPAEVGAMFRAFDLRRAA